MEAAGLAVGVVSLGLDLATRLQTYIDGVKGAGDRVSELTANISATASVVQQLAALVEADAQAKRSKNISHLGQCEDGTGPEPLVVEEPNGSIFTSEGVYQIEALLRRCDRIYKAIVTVIGSATTDGFLGTKTLLTGVGVGDLTARRLARLKTKALWPWLEPRVQTCVKQLEAVKVDLLLNLQIASLAQCRIGTRKPVLEGEARAMKDAAKHLIKKKETARGTPIVSRIYSTTTPGARDSNIPSPRISSRTRMYKPRSQEPAVTSSSSDAPVFPPGHPREFLYGRFAERPPLPPLGIVPPPPMTLRGWGYPTTKLYTDNTPREFGASSTVPSYSYAQNPHGHPPIAKGPAEMQPSSFLSFADDTTNQPTPRLGTEVPQSVPNDKQALLPGSKEKPACPAEASEEECSHVEGMLIGPLGSDDEVEAWFVLRDSVDGPLSKVPVQGAAARKMLEVEDANSSSTLDDYLALTPDQRTAVQEVMDAMRRRDARLRTLVSLRRTDLPGGAKLVVLVATKSREQYVSFTDCDSQVWRVPFYGLKSAIVRGRGDVSTMEEELRNRCGSRALQEKGYMIQTNQSGKGEAITLYSLRDVLRPGINLRIVSAAEHWNPTLGRSGIWARGFRVGSMPTPFLAEPTRPESPQGQMSATYIPYSATLGEPDHGKGIGIPAAPQLAPFSSHGRSRPSSCYGPAAPMAANESERWSPKVSDRVQEDYPLTTVDRMEERKIMRELFGEEEIEAAVNEEKPPSVDALLKRWTTTGTKKRSRASAKSG